MSRATSAFHLDEVVALARARNASDIHLAPGLAPSIRVDGRIEGLPCAAVFERDMEQLCERLVTGTDRAALRRSGDVSVGIELPGAGRSRAHLYATVDGLCAALRLFPAEVPSLESLGLPQSVGELDGHRHGLILFAGPTGSGKSTSLAAFVRRVSERSARHIITIEDPVEYRHASSRSIVRQRQVGTEVASFDLAVMGALRSDPDVIVIGEMRDASTMRAALVAAETGHLVVASIHTSGAAATVSRIVDAFPPDAQSAVRTQLAHTLVGVVSQRLVPALDGGRRCAVEVLIADDAVRAVVRDGKTHQLRNLIATSRGAGMITFEESLGGLVASGEVAPGVAIAFADRPDEVRCGVGAP